MASVAGPGSEVCLKLPQAGADLPLGQWPGPATVRIAVSGSDQGFPRWGTAAAAWQDTRHGTQRGHSVNASVSDSAAAGRSSGVARQANPAGNEKLTAIAGAVLLILFSAEVITTLLMGSLFGLHFFLGMVLIGPVCVKIGSTV